ncbi:type III-B CRISPR-associated protein Cas10/Cmr2 [Desulfosporosinus shakirovi]|uniref:type III-B CRISPR-associated protein Cas10/Cmr2 n=1 Tax=Desulfosporosinus shakirovi TaxID=2885154 RepID=UPI001E3CC7DB|nr:type III-B CRISPR-associated protein Cas10/Cmr2 [Desulfosporosinus sp. SRJS8]MCB8818364.1 type III-B CRISPR-associated protein Cas10/Cmr2 [Desulfosporosinus sp. SRJS8]
MKKALFVFTIGPVKSLINQSRKIRDLYAGSYLLSFLMSKAIEELQKKKRVEIIFPSVQTDKDNSIPNRLVAIISGYTESEQERLGTSLAAYTQNAFIDICNRIFDKLSITPNQWAKEQLERFLEVFWVFQEYERYEAGYPQMVRSINGLKKLRMFAQTNEPYGRKCTLYPESNIVFAKSSSGKFQKFVLPEQIVDITDTDSCKYAIKPTEGLSSVALVKRMLSILWNEKEDGSPVLTGYRSNISSVAYMLLKSRLGTTYEADLKMLGDEASETIFDLQNGQILSEDEYRLESIDAAKELYKKIKNNHIVISPYYALVKFDGDGMGNLYLTHPDMDFHQRLSADLCGFATSVRGIISRHHGICIYAGGEDFLGFLPLDSLFNALFELHKEFPNQVKTPQGHSTPLTFSAGIAIGHIMQPLDELIAKSSELEASAKSIDKNKNAFAIELMKRSGEKITIINKFGIDCENLKIVYATLLDLQENKYSKAFVQNLTEVLERIKDTEDDEKHHMVQTLIKQALKLSDTTVNHDQQAEDFFRLYQRFSFSIAQFIDVLQAVSFLSREVESCSTKSML